MVPVPNIGNWVDRLLPGKRTIKAGFFFFFLPHNMQDIIYLTRDQTHAPCMESQPLDHQGSKHSIFFKVSFEISPQLMSNCPFYKGCSLPKEESQ